MSLEVRSARDEDLPRLHLLVREGGRRMYGEPVMAALPGLWRALVRERRLTLHVFEDTDRPAGERIQGVASGGFVDPAFADDLVRDYHPGAADRVFAAEMEGRPLLLTRDQAARANAGDGLCALGLDFAFAHREWSLGTVLRWTPRLLTSMHRWLDGWQLRLGLRELVGRDLYLAYRASGIALHGRHTRDGTRSLPGRDCRYLVGLTREQARRRPTALASVMFFRTGTPVLGFSPAEQDLLELALENLDDEACAARLGVAPGTIKMRWRTLFERVARQQPELLGPAAAAVGDGQRGPEKRRHLLAWLREHMEEVRPH